MIIYIIRSLNNTHPRLPFLRKMREEGSWEWAQLELPEVDHGRKEEVGGALRSL